MCFCCALFCASLAAKARDDASVIVGVTPNDNGEIKMSDNPLAYTIAESRRVGRRRNYCCCPCCDEARRARNFAASGATRSGSPAISRSVQKDDVELTIRKVRFGDRAPIELFGHGYRWCGAVRAFRLSQADIPTRPEAIRRLLQQAVAVSLRQVGTEGSDR